MSDGEVSRLDEHLARIDKFASLSKWLVGALLALVAFVFMVGQEYRGVRDDLTQVQIRLTKIETDRELKIQDYTDFKRAIEHRLTTIESEQASQGRTLTAIADRLGVIPKP